MIRSVLAVLAGLVVTFVGSFGMDAVVLAILPGWFPKDQPLSTAALMLILSYMVFFSLVGGYVTAWIARRRKVWHGLALGVTFVVIGLSVSGLVFLFARVNPEAAAALAKEAEHAPMWFNILCVALALPAPILGAFLRSWQKPTPLAVSGQTA